MCSNSMLTLAAWRSSISWNGKDLFCHPDALRFKSHQSGLLRPVAADTPRGVPVLQGSADQAVRRLTDLDSAEALTAF